MDITTCSMAFVPESTLNKILTNHINNQIEPKDFCICSRVGLTNMYEHVFFARTIVAADWTEKDFITTILLHDRCKSTFSLLHIASNSGIFLGSSSLNLGISKNQLVLLVIGILVLLFIEIFKLKF